MVALAIIGRVDHGVARTGRLSNLQRNLLGVAEAILQRVATNHIGERVIADIRTRADQA